MMCPGNWLAGCGCATARATRSGTRKWTDSFWPSATSPTPRSSRGRSKPTATATSYPRAARAPISRASSTRETCRIASTARRSPLLERGAWRPSKSKSFWNRKDFFVLDTDYLDAKQLTWLEKELSNDGTDWKICYFHHPLYSSGKTHGSSTELRLVLEPLFVKYGVQVV